MRRAVFPPGLALAFFCALAALAAAPARAADEAPLRRLTVATAAPGMKLVLCHPTVPPAAVLASLEASGPGAGEAGGRVAAVSLSAWDPDGDNSLWEAAFPGKVRLEE